MTVSQTDVAHIQAKLAGVLGQKVWGAEHGHSSFLTLEFGRPVSPSSVTQEAQKNHGEWHLWIYGAMWRLEESKRILTASQDSDAKLDAAIQRLNGLALLSVDMQTPALDTTFLFEEHVRLRLFNIYAKTDFDSWMLFTPDKVLTLQSDGHWTYGE